MHNFVQKLEKLSEYVFLPHVIFIHKLQCFYSQSQFSTTTPASWLLFITAAAWGWMPCLRAPQWGRKGSVTNCLSVSPFLGDCIQGSLGVPGPCAENTDVSTACRHTARGGNSCQFRRFPLKQHSVFFRRASIMWLFLMRWIIRTAGWHIWTTGGQGGWA